MIMMIESCGAAAVGRQAGQLNKYYWRGKQRKFATFVPFITAYLDI